MPSYKSKATFLWGGQTHLVGIGIELIMVEELTDCEDQRKHAALARSSNKYLWKSVTSQNSERQ